MLSYEVWICLFRYVRSYFKSYVRLDRHSFDKFYTFFSNFNQHDNFYNLLMSSLGENNVTWLGRYLSFRLRIVSYTVAVTVTCVLVPKDKYDMRQKQRLWYSCCQLLTHFPFRFASHLHRTSRFQKCRRFICYHFIITIFFIFLSLTSRLSRINANARMFSTFWYYTFTYVWRIFWLLR